MQKLAVDRGETLGFRISRRLKGEQSLGILTGRVIDTESREEAADHSNRFSIRYRIEQIISDTR